MWGGFKKGVGMAAEYLPKIGHIATTLGPLLAGFGKYHVKKNSLMAAARVGTKRKRGDADTYTDSGFVTNSPPMFASSGVGSDVVFTHAEYVADVQSATNFTRTDYLLNAGNPVLFPWLSQIAALYEEYEFLGLVFEYRTTSAMAVGTTSSAMGTVIIATDYDVYDNAFVTKRNMEAAEYATPGAPYQTFCHPVECDRKRNVLGKEYVVPGATSIAQLPGDARMSAYGMTSVACVGQQTAGTAQGELWVTYHVRLSRPVLENSAVVANFSQHIQTSATTGGVTTLVSNTSTGSPFTLTQLSAGSNQFQVLAPAASPLVGGQFMLVMVPTCTASGAWSGTANVAAGGTTVFPNRLRAATAPCNIGSGKDVVIGTYSSYPYVAIFNIVAGGDFVSVTIPYNAANASLCDCYISSINASLSGERRSRIRAIESVENSDIVQLKEELKALRVTVDGERTLIADQSKDEKEEEEYGVVETTTPGRNAGVPLQRRATNR